MAYKLGKLDAVRPHALADLSDYAVGKLPGPPTSCTVPPVATWGMDGNDRVGDCTMAGAAHLIAAWDVEAGEHDPVPASTTVVREYFVLTGGPDSGLVEHEVLKTWYRQGLWGNRLGGYAPVRPGDVTALHQAIAFYGGAYVGVQLPSSAQTQFSTGQPWTVDPSSPIEGGHCIVFVGYDPQFLYAVTWGQVVKVTYPWWGRYGDEAWVALSQEYSEAGRGPALDLASLRADLAKV